ncbi:MAG: DUF4038 domain-containing protein [Chloroflexi bacterium]|uniref:apiosidase-like domain-containing protein n=1 Tax=Candidatus Flexifilum breve TaxID=3140694 RepID=UPI003135CC5B|nr:DUF4038 domain-containing protein [Chloroflexota bacterium]
MVARTVDAFWDGGRTFHVRFMPDQIGAWHYECASTDAGLNAQRGAFVCEPNDGATRFDRHGAVQVSDNRRYLAHADGTPFFWLADTCWNGPLRATSDEWAEYLNARIDQGFNTVQWVATQWISAPDGDLTGALPFEGHERISVKPDVFQRLDAKQDSLNAAGLLSVPVLLWAAEWGDPTVMAINPGLTLPEDQAILLARYMVARWGANHVCWILPGDGNYLGVKADRWRRIGRAVFDGAPHAPVTLHPNGLSWYGSDFRHEDWLDFLGYQSCHFGDPDSLAWIVRGAPASDWTAEPARPIINLEPNYEYHLDIADRSRRFEAYDVRRAMYWSLLVSPMAGVTYGGHGVWGWDDGTAPPVAHEMSGIPLHWRQALHMPGAEQMRHLLACFTSANWWQLQPDPALVVAPTDSPIAHAITAARVPDGSLALVYLPAGGTVELAMSRLPDPPHATWFDPRTGASHPAEGASGCFTAPDSQDWLLVVRA